jgi:integrase
MGKRGNGEGSISRRKNGGWCAQYVVYTSEGRKRRTLSGKTRKEVAAKLSKALADREVGLVFDAGTLTVGEYLDRWLSHSARGRVRQKTYERYESIVRVHLVPALGRIRLKALTPDHVRGLYPARSWMVGWPHAPFCTSIVPLARHSNRQPTTA